MSVEAMAWALAQPLKGSQKLLLLGLANHATAEGEHARPGIERLAIYGSVSDRNAQKGLRQLETEGWIEKTGSYPVNGRRDRVVNVYRLIFKRGVATDAPQAERGVSRDPNGVSPPTPEPSLEPSKYSTTSQTSGDQPEIDEAFETRVERFLDFHGARVEGAGATKPAKTKAAREAARWILRKESDAAQVVSRLDWALAHPFFSGQVLTVAGFRKHWDRLTVQWRASVEADRRRRERGGNGNRDDGRSETFGIASVSYEGDRVVIKR